MKGILGAQQQFLREAGSLLPSNNTNEGSVPFKQSQGADIVHVGSLEAQLGALF